VVAVIEVLLATVTPGAAVPPKLTTAPALKLVPPMITGVPPPAGPAWGEIAVTKGAGFTITKV
jgi:hypothetical protein